MHAQIDPPIVGPWRPFYCLVILAALAYVTSACGDGGRSDATPTAAPTATPTVASGLLAWASGTSTVHGAAEGAVVRSDDGGATWLLTLTLAGTDLNAIAFANRRRGWAVGTTIALTEDGGLTWTHSPAVDITSAITFALFDVETRTSEAAIAVGADLSQPTGGDSLPLVLVTEDGGANWMTGQIPTTTPPGHLTSVCVGNDGLALAVGNGLESGNSTALLSSDGGQAWVLISDRIPALARPFDTACFGTDLWIVGGNGDRLWHSDDSGVTWVEESNNIPASDLITALTFVDRDVGWATAVDRAQVPLVLHTKDGGQTWSEQPLSGDAADVIVGVSFADDGYGVVVGQHQSMPFSGRALHTIDGGLAWMSGVLPQGTLRLSSVAVRR